MVLLTLEKPYTVHARSIDRSGVGHTPSSYKLVLRDAIKCHSHHYMKATLLSATIPSTFYQIDERNTSFTVGFNRTTFTALQPYLALPLQDNTGEGTSTRNDYERTVSVSIAKGNYDIESLLAEIKTKLNDACTASANFNSFRTFFRSQDTASTLYTQDLADAGKDSDDTPYTKDYVLSTPQFDWYYSKTLNKMRLFRTDSGGKMLLGKWDIQTTGVKLGMGLGFNHITAQQLRDLNLSASVKTSVENSVHYRETTLTEYNDFTILNPTNTKEPFISDNTNKQYKQFGHSVFSMNCVNMFANDSVYLRISNLPSNAYETLYGGLTNVMAVIPMYSGSSTENFYSPSNTTSTVVGSNGVSELDVKITDAFGEELNFNGVEHSFQIMFEAFEDGTRENKPAEKHYAELNRHNAFENIHPYSTQRTSVPHNRPQRRVYMKPHLVS